VFVVRSIWHSHMARTYAICRKNEKLCNVAVEQTIIYHRAVKV